MEVEQHKHLLAGPLHMESLSQEEKKKQKKTTLTNFAGFPIKHCAFMLLSQEKGSSAHFMTSRCQECLIGVQLQLCANH